MWKLALEHRFDFLARRQDDLHGYHVQSSD